MGNRREHVDEYAETLVLPHKPDTVQAVASSHADNLALYEEYARAGGEVVAAPAAKPKRSAGRRKR